MLSPLVGTKQAVKVCTFAYDAYMCEPELRTF